MPERLVRQRRGLVYFQRVAAPQRAEHAAVLLLRRAHFTTLRHDVPGVALHWLSLWLCEGLARRAGEDGEHVCWAGAASATLWRCGELFLWRLCGALWTSYACSVVARCREELLNDRQRVVTPSPLLPRRQMRGAAAAHQASVDCRVAPHSSVSRRLAEQSDQKNACEDGSISCGL